MPHTSRGQTSDGGISPPSRRPPGHGNDRFRLHVVGGGTHGTRGGVGVGPARAGQYRPSGCVRPDRHHPQPDPRNGMRNFPLLRRAATDTLAYRTASRTDTLAHHTDTLAHVHPQRKRSCREGRRHRHPPGPSGPPTEVQMDSEPESLPTQKVHSPLIGNHAPSGWLRDRGMGLQTHPWH